MQLHEHTLNKIDHFTMQFQISQVVLLIVLRSQKLLFVKLKEIVILWNLGKLSSCLKFGIKWS